MLGSVLLVGCVLVGQAEARADEGLRRKVQMLVKQLDAPQLARREAAEKELIELGPKVLDLLPRPDRQMSPGVKQRISRIRQILQRAVAESVAKASLVTLRGEAVPLSRILAALRQQSGNKIIFGHVETDPVLKVDFDKTPFWQALDRVLDQAELKVRPSDEGEAIRLGWRGETELPRTGRASYNGPFRFEPTQIMARRDLRDPSAKVLWLTLEVAWEPRLKPISLKHKMAELKAVDENGNPLALADSQAEPEVPAAGTTSVKLPIRLKLPPRSVKEIASLTGRLTAMIPGRVETFRFDDLINAKNVEKRIAGVTVTLNQVRRNNEVWEVRMRVRFDEAGSALESHRGWIDNNQAYLEGRDGKPIRYYDRNFTEQDKNEVAISYVFDLDGPPDKHKFVYKTPGVIVTTGFDYEIKGVKLP